MINLDSPLDQISGLKPRQQKALSNLGIKTYRDLLFHFPFRYEDFSKISPISNISNDEISTVQGRVVDIDVKRSWKKKMVITEALIQDESESVRVVWFGQKFIGQTLKIGKEVRISGKVSSDSKGLLFSSPSWELSTRMPTHTGRLVPIYPETDGITSKWLRWQVQMLFKKGFKISDAMPQDMIEDLNLPEIGKALKLIHFPKNEDHYLVAQKRFAFEEMLLLQIKSLQTRSTLSKEKAEKIKKDVKETDNFISSLPFELTKAQKRSFQEILADMEKGNPMNRLLNGDVGAGKTIIAAIASLLVTHSGKQVSIMAPTEVLARQHFEEFCKIFSTHDINIGLLTNSYKLFGKNGLQKKTTRPSFLKKIKSGEINIIIGTHAIIQKDVHFKNLALVIVDEQHRFGVNQRAYLQQASSKAVDGIKNKIPHFLTMTATPIPRTLTMAFFGNLDISLLDEMPKSRKNIVTKIVPPQKRDDVYNFISSEIKRGRQAFVILPLVEESKALSEVKAAVSEHERLSKKIFPTLKLGLLHGRLKSKEKEEVMKKFKEKEFDILVSTSVVEVGIDVPNATIMIIEDASRFGLSQLHQFRGRVGRGEHQSYCFLFAPSATQRLKALEKYSDGFKISQKDLEIRGPGQFLGTRQSGLPDITMENIANIKLIQISREKAENLLSIDSDLKNHPLLKDALQKFEEKIHLE